MLKILVVAAALAASAAVPMAAFAAPAHLTDGQYLAAVRCRALVASPALGKGDTRALDSLLAAQRNGRVPAVFDRADETRADATREAGHAGVQERAQLVAERDGVCQAFAGAATTTAAAAQPTGAD